MGAENANSKFVFISSSRGKSNRECADEGLAHVCSFAREISQRAQSSSADDCRFLKFKIDTMNLYKRIFPPKSVQ